MIRDFALIMLGIAIQMFATYIVVCVFKFKDNHD
jgi:hypothetical protein